MHTCDIAHRCYEDTDATDNADLLSELPFSEIGMRARLALRAAATGSPTVDVSARVHKHIVIRTRDKDAARRLRVQQGREVVNSSNEKPVHGTKEEGENTDPATSTGVNESSESTSRTEKEEDLAEALPRTTF